MSKRKNNSDYNNIAWFISPHGFGHAARSAAVMESLLLLDPSLHIHIFTQVPKWFFEDSLSCAFDYHPVLTDVGLIQKDPLHEDITETIRVLDDFLPFDDALIAGLSRQISDLNCGVIVCDIAPIGIAVAKTSGIASLLIENFTWNWIYEGYRHQNCRIMPHIEYLRHLFESADYHIQTEPVCISSPDANLTTLPISRKLRTHPEIIRKQLNIPHDSKAVLITMGGIEGKYGFLDKLEAYPEVYFVIPGASCLKKIQKRLILLPHHSQFYHPDLVNACDAVIGKVGYSTLAEVWQAGVPFGYVPRPFFPESEKLTRYIEQQMSGMMIEDYEFEAGRWLSTLKELLSMPRTQRNSSDGAVQAARFILHTLVQNKDNVCCKYKL